MQALKALHERLALLCFSSELEQLSDLMGSGKDLLRARANVVGSEPESWQALVQQIEAEVDLSVLLPSHRLETLSDSGGSSNREAIEVYNSYLEDKF